VYLSSYSVKFKLKKKGGFQIIIRHPAVDKDGGGRGGSNFFSFSQAPTSDY